MKTLGVFTYRNIFFKKRSTALQTTDRQNISKLQKFKFIDRVKN